MTGCLFVAADFPSLFFYSTPIFHRLILNSFENRGLELISNFLGLYWAVFIDWTLLCFFRKIFLVTFQRSMVSSSPNLHDSYSWTEWHFFQKENIYLQRCFGLLSFYDLNIYHLNFHIGFSYCLSFFRVPSMGPGHGACYRVFFWTPIVVIHGLMWQ